MARLALGIGTSHGPQLNMPPEIWRDRAVADRANRGLVYQGKTYNYQDLLSARHPGFAKECEPAVQQRRHASARAAVAEVGRTILAADLDVLITISSDHKEIFDDHLLPQFAVFWGDTFQHEPLSEAQLNTLPPGLAVAEKANTPEVSTSRRGHAELALHLIRATSAAGFDPSASHELPAGRFGDHGIPHGWGFIFQQVLQGGGHDIATVPVFVNTFYDPNPPAPARCFDFGVALGEAVASFPSDLKVGVVGSGGLSHFVVDEDLDGEFLEALVAGDEKKLKSLPAEWLRSGTSEYRSWLVAAGAVHGSTLLPRVIGYEPCYRSEAGTGCAMGFVAWEPEGGTGAA